MSPSSSGSGKERILFRGRAAFPLTSRTFCQSGSSWRHSDGRLTLLGQLGLDGLNPLVFFRNCCLWFNMALYLFMTSGVLGIAADGLVWYLLTCDWVLLVRDLGRTQIQIWFQFRNNKCQNISRNQNSMLLLQIKLKQSQKMSHIVE